MINIDYIDVYSLQVSVIVRDRRIHNDFSPS